MSEDTQAISILSETECWDLLGSVSLGRLVTSVDGQPEIFPVNFVVQHRSVLFRTAEGTKLVSTAINNQVLFEADGSTFDEGWSVIVKGTARAPRTDDELEEARRAWLFPWTATSKPHFVRIRPLRSRGADSSSALNPTPIDAAPGVPMAAPTTAPRPGHSAASVRWVPARAASPVQLAGRNMSRG